ncbi:hypothetical protein B0G71_2569 [Paraburkholderia sp. BL27I4N3]|uniref:hypothetical protein n=1 Tax=Paraburkholderia sp. BL27I4N3 TaxID=1938805 RepID=UPI000E287F5B|nr:hypothetical protein [Paraburkholderia sp. BL27I4N3]REE19472.1 hypothetical protein B0G71_2569 [Paraburkholderia sp. BL27I4N3]
MTIQTVTSITTTHEGETHLLRSRTVSYTDVEGAARTLRLEGVDPRDSATVALVAAKLPADIVAAASGLGWTTAAAQAAAWISGARRGAMHGPVDPTLHNPFGNPSNVSDW